MNFKTTLYLLVILAMVGAYVYFIAPLTRPTHETEQDFSQGSPEEGQRLFSDDELDAQRITRVKIDRGESAQMAQILVVMNAQGTFEIMANISEVDIASIAVGNPLRGGRGRLRQRHHRGRAQG